jgi:hypothetical protein
VIKKKREHRAERSRESRAVQLKLKGARQKLRQPHNSKEMGMQSSSQRRRGEGMGGMG